MFEIYTDKAGEYRFRLKGKNGRITIHSTDGYEDKNDIKDIINDVLTQTNKFIIEFRNNVQKKPYIVFMTKDYNPIARTEAYFNKSNANRALKKIAIMLSDFRTKVVDLTEDVALKPLLNDYSYDEDYDEVEN